MLTSVSRSHYFSSCYSSVTTSRSNIFPSYLTTTSTWFAISTTSWTNRSRKKCVDITLSIVYSNCRSSLLHFYFLQNLKGYRKNFNLTSTAVVKALMCLYKGILMSNGLLYKYDIEQYFSDFEVFLEDHHLVDVNPKKMAGKKRHLIQLLSVLACFWKAVTYSLNYVTSFSN